MLNARTTVALSIALGLLAGGLGGTVTVAETHGEVAVEAHATYRTGSLTGPLTGGEASEGTQDAGGSGESEASPAEPASHTGLRTVYRHHDCVGPRLPGIAGPHRPNPHADTLEDLHAGPVTFTVSPLSPATTGGCPVTATSVPLLEDGFTGRYTFTATCAKNTVNQGAVWIQVETDYLAGWPVTQSNTEASPCLVPKGETFDAKLEIEIGPVRLPTGALNEIGGISIVVEQ